MSPGPGLFGAELPADASPAELLRRAEETRLQVLREKVRLGRVLRPVELKDLRELSARAAGGETAGNLEGVAAALGVSKRTVLRWAKRAAIPEETGGWYDLAKARAWAAPFLAEGGAAEDEAPEGPAAAGGEGLARTWRQEREREAALLARVKRERLEGALLARAAVVPEFVRRALEVKERTLGLSRGLARLLVGTWKDPRDVAAVVEPYVREIVASYCRELPQELAGEADPAALHLVPEAALRAMAAELPAALAREPGRAAELVTAWAQRLRGAATELAAGSG